MAERKLPEVSDYPSNAIGTKTEIRREPPEKLSMRGGVTKSRRSNIFKAARDEFISEDAPNIGSYIIYDILLPALRDMISDIGHGALDMAMGTETRRYDRRDYGRSSYISYDRYYDDRDRRKRDRDEERRARRRGDRDLDEMVFKYREDAEDVLDRMCDYIERYGDVPVSYFYDLCGETVPGDFTSDDWGWTNLSQAKVSKAGRKGYYIDFPRARQL